MKLFRTLFTLIILSVLLFVMSSCERDDICAADTLTTPLLIIKFIDDDTKQDIKQPVDLEVRSTDSSISDSLPNVVSRDSIMIPLKTNSLITEFKFTINATNSDPADEDIISFQYTPQQEYVSSACGFKVNYLGITTSIISTTDNWIKGIDIKQENITDETSAHILIYH